MSDPQAPQPPPEFPPQQPFGSPGAPQPPGPGPGMPQPPVGAPGAPGALGVPGAPGAPQPPEPESASQPARTEPPYGFDEKGRVRRTKVSGVWIGLIAAAVVLILLIVFIAQNLNTVGLHFLGFYGEVSLGLALLVAAICGILIAAVPGSVRILQLRKSLRRNVDVEKQQRP